MRIKSFAKVNLGLEVLGLRPDGYHNLRTLIQSVSLADELAFFPESGGRVVLHGSDPSIPWDKTNLVFRAARALKDRYPRTPGARIEVTKSIPTGTGLGGGSSNAAMTLLGLDRLWGLGLEKEELMDIGRSLGADVPYFLRGGLCLGLDRGDRIVPLEDLPALPLVIALPPFSCRTADIYREHRLALMGGEVSLLPGQARTAKGWRGEGAPAPGPWRGKRSAFPLPTVASLPASPSRTSSCDQGGIPPWNPRSASAERAAWPRARPGKSRDRTPLQSSLTPGKEWPASGVKLTSAVEDSRIEQFFRSRELRFLENNLEATVFRFHPRLQDLKALFRSRGAELSLVTGSGSAVFGLFRDKRQAEEAGRAAEREYPAVLAETVPRGRYEGEMWAGV